MQFSSIVSSRAAPGALAFILVVVFTMFASIAFDPRLMWDAATERETSRIDPAPQPLVASNLPLSEH